MPKSATEFQNLLQTRHALKRQEKLNRKLIQDKALASVTLEQTMKEEKKDMYTTRDRTRNIYSTSNEQEQNAVFSLQQSVVQLLHLKGRDVQCHY